MIKLFTIFRYSCEILRHFQQNETQMNGLLNKINKRYIQVLGIKRIRKIVYQRFSLLFRMGFYFDVNIFVHIS